MALVAEAWPSDKRGAGDLAIVGLGWQFGVLCAALVTPILLPLIGWRGMFAVGLFPAPLAAYCDPAQAARRARHLPGTSGHDDGCRRLASRG
ncbi:hypothetical protein ACU4GH_28695 [Bradyrhizobium betae]